MAVFSLAVRTTVPQLSGKFWVQVTSGEVTGSGQVTPPLKKKLCNRVMFTVIEMNIWNFQDLRLVPCASRIFFISLTDLGSAQFRDLPTLAAAAGRQRWGHGHAVTTKF